ncbi:MAG: hypothetical protein K0S36_1713 [Nitrosospira multiformis]|nr:hypothetical protein [Nitrosospira multiformis]
MRGRAMCTLDILATALRHLPSAATRIALVTIATDSRGDSGEDWMRMQERGRTAASDGLFELRVREYG